MDRRLPRLRIIARLRKPRGCNSAVTIMTAGCSCVRDQCDSVRRSNNCDLRIFALRHLASYCRAEAMIWLLEMRVELSEVGLRSQFDDRLVSSEQAAKAASATGGRDAG